LTAAQNVFLVGFRGAGADGCRYGMTTALFALPAIVSQATLFRVTSKGGEVFALSCTGVFMVLAIGNLILLGPA
jgi:hypothetical protein